MQTTSAVDQDQLIRDLDDSTTRFEEALRGIDDTRFHVRPCGEAWSPAETGEHLLLTEIAVGKTLRRAHPTDRPINAKVMAMQQGLANRSRRIEAPETIRPTSGKLTKDELVDGIRRQRVVLKEIIRQSDLSETTDYLHPVIGDMTRLEWILFLVFHMDRHIGQLRGER